MRKSTPPFEELINRFIACIIVRHPETEINESFAETLAEAWKGKDKQLYAQVKLMENNEVKINNLQKRIDVRQVEFQTGVDILGFPTFTTHYLKFENSFKDPSRYKKKGSDFKSRLVKAIQFNHIQNGFVSRLLPV